MGYIYTSTNINSFEVNICTLMGLEGTGTAKDEGYDYQHEEHLSIL